MSEPQLRVTRWAVEAEIKACDIKIAEETPAVNPAVVAHRDLLKSALDELRRWRPE